MANKIKYSDIQTMLNKLRECDQIIEKCRVMSITPGMLDALIGACIQRRANLLERLKKEYGIDIEV